MTEAMSFTERMRHLASEARSKKVQEQNPNWKLDKTISDITKFFESEVKKDAMNKIETRAQKGCNSSNILEYEFFEYFYVTRNDRIVRVSKYEKKEGFYLHRIHDVVNGQHFQNMLNEFVNSLGDMRVACWYPGNNMNVVEVYWGPTKVHKWDDENTTTTDE